MQTGEYLQLRTGWLSKDWRKGSNKCMLILASHRNQWTAMFPSRSSNIGNDLPLWAVQDDFKAGVSSVDTFMGGWTKAYAKQYHLGTSLCSVGFDPEAIS